MVRSTTRRGTPWIEIGLTCVLLLILAGRWIASHPVSLRELADAEQIAEAGENGGRADVLVVLPSVPEAITVEQWATDAAWLNTVDQEIGSVRAASTGELSRSLMDAAAWVIIPKRAAAQLDPTQTQFVRNWVEDGGTVFLEQPEGPWRGLIGQNLRGARYRETRRLTSFDGALARGELRADMLEMPLSSTLLPYAPPNLARGRDYQVPMEIDGLPGVVRLNIGRGHVFVVLFDMGMAVAMTQQGRPQSDFSVPRVDGDPLPSAVAHAERLVVDDALLRSTIPHIDLIERNVLYLADVHRPVPRLWYYPATYRGALVTGHSESRFGARASYMTDWEHENEVRSTVFAVADSLSPEALARQARKDIDLQLQWVPTAHPGAPRRTWGVRAFRPVERPMSLREQQTTLDHDLIPYGPVRVNRTLDGLWTPDALAAFRRLEAAGVGLDASYGPAPAWWSVHEASIGYLFGTGFPFRPLDRNGERFEIRELPIVAHGAAPGTRLSTIRQLLVDASAGYHTTIAVDYPPDLMARRPSYDAIEGWRQAFAIAESQELWVTTFVEYLDFLERRDESRVWSEFSREERRLTVHVDVVGPTSGLRDAWELTPSIAFPARFEGRPVERLWVDGAPIDPADLALTGDRVLHLYPLEPGEHRLQVVYASPVELPPADE